MQLEKSGQRFLELVEKGTFRKEFTDRFNFEFIDKFTFIYDRLESIIKIQENSNIVYPITLISEVEKQFEMFFFFYDIIVRDFKEAFEVPAEHRNDYLEKKIKARKTGSKTNLFDDFDWWFKTIFTGENFQNSPNNFLQTYQAVIILKYEKRIQEITSSEEFPKNIAKNKKDFDDLISEINQKREKTNRILEETEEKLKERTISDYALEFQKMADRYSGIKISWTNSQFQVGLSAWSLFIGIILILVLPFLLYYSSFYFPIDSCNSTEVNIVNTASRLLCVSLVVFLIGFSFRQYGIFQHLHTLNRHKQNALNSYKLFNDSFGSGEEGKEMKEALLREVAKTIYDFNTSGFISQKGNEGLPSILELTKIIKSSGTK